MGVYVLKDLAWRIAEYVYSKSFKDLSPQAIEEAKKRILDSLAVSLGALEAFPYRVSRELALKAVSRSRGSTVWWENAHSIPELATFANSVGIRYLDFNDTYLSKEAMHPSDMIPAVAAVAEDKNAYSLSAGRAHLVSIARGFVLDPEIIFLDEPFTYLDSEKRSLLAKALQRRRALGRGGYGIT